MRILTTTLRSYRLHRELTVDFDPSITLIGGPNESGKSTLAEAVHRALFLRAKVTGEVQKSMVSHIHGGHPEVELRFEARSNSYHLLKRFSGANGTITLTGADGSTWNGEEAETRLANLLGVRATGGGRGAGERAREQWGHLWIWQGSSSRDPIPHANSQSTALLSRLQDEGGGAAMQSEADARVAREMSERYEALFNRNGSAKAGSELASAISKENGATARLTAARANLSKLEYAITSFQEAGESISNSDATLMQLGETLETTETQLARVVILRGEEQIQSLIAANARDQHETLLRTDTRIGQLREEIIACRASLEPKESETDRLSQNEIECRQRAEAADRAWPQAMSHVREARMRCELAVSRLDRIEKETQREQLEKKLLHVRELRTHLHELETRLAETPGITTEKLAALETVATECSRAAEALNAMAAGLEVLASDLPVMVDGRAMASGESHILTDAAEVIIGHAIRLKIRPGGGANLGQTRQRLLDARTNLQRMLDAEGVASMIDAAAAAARWQRLQSDIQVARARLDGFGADTIDQDFAEAVNSLKAAEADLERRAALVVDFSAPATREEGMTLLRQSSRQLAESETKESEARASRAVAVTALERARGLLTAHRSGLENQRRAVADLEAQLRFLVETHGEDSARTARIARLEAVRHEAERLLGITRQGLAELQPEMLERDRSRYQRAVEQHVAAKNQAGQKLAVARSELVRDGTTDPHAELELAESEAQSAMENRVIQERKAGAIRLLHELFVAEQQVLADQFTGPLAAKISGYLECIFGQGARAIVEMNGTEFTGFRLIRPAFWPGALEFGSLSGGTCEQVAAAVRLAMAEVLASAHDGCLPVLFDDAFAWSDPSRVQPLQRMLDHAASRGLQVIVLTCNAADYTTLGARQITLGP